MSASPAPCGGADTISITRLPSVPSTNTWMKEHSSEFGHGHVLVTDDQTAGRGQRGNFWESDPGKNLTFSLMLRPKSITPAGQFAISEAVALGVVELLRHHLKGWVNADDIRVKWPNDIYVANDKIAGILIENTICGHRIDAAVAGIGLNVNQTIFRSPAPNPVSMTQLAAITFPLEELLTELASNILRRLDHIDGNQETAQEQHKEFHSAMWRHDGQPHRFSLPDGTRFKATISHVEPDGMLQLRHTDGTTASYAFKEVIFL